MKKITIIISILLLAIVVPTGFLMAAMTSQHGYQIWADVVSVGGSEDSVSGGSFQLRDTLGEPIISRSSSTSGYSSRAGFREMEIDTNTQVLTLSVGANSVDLGELNKTQAKVSSHVLTVDTNSPSGVRVLFSGNTLTGASGTIAPIGDTAAVSHPGTSQFGLNASYSSGDVAAQAQSPYNSSGLYAFHSGDDIISSSGALTGPTAFNIGYLANISGAEPSGNYSTNITYTAIANF